MHSQLDTILDEAENRYLKPEELTVLSQYVSSLPERMDAYRTLRDREIEMMQQVADQLQQEMPNESEEAIERCLKHALLTLRYCSMAMLMNDESFIRNHLTNWLSEIVKVYNTQAIDAAIYRLLTQRLTQALNPKQLALLNPMLTTAQQLMAETSSSSAEDMTAAALGW